MAAVEPAARRAQRARVHRLEHGVAARGDALEALRPLLRGRTPREEDDAGAPLLGHDLEHPLREALPALALVRVRLVRLHGQARVEEEDAAVRPRGQQAAVLGRRVERGVVLLQRLAPGVSLACKQGSENPGANAYLVDIQERRRRGRRRAHGKAHAVRLVEVMIRVLADDDDLDGGEGRVAAPGIDVVERGEDLFAGGGLGPEEALELEEGRMGEVGGEVGQPGVVQGLDLELQQRLLLVRQRREPLLLVEFGGFARGGRGAGRGGIGLCRGGRLAYLTRALVLLFHYMACGVDTIKCLCHGNNRKQKQDPTYLLSIWNRLRRAKERSDGGILRLLRWVFGQVRRLTLYCC